jgi:hypothetical protein
MCCEAAISGKRTLTSMRFLADGATLITPQFWPIAMVRE